jgi:8-oxo-dGTP diphosphatase
MLKHKLLSNISVDCVIFGFDFEKLNVILLERELMDEKTGEYLINDHTLTGFHIYEDEDTDMAASRILNDLTGLKDIYLDQFATFGKMNRVNNPKDTLWRERLNQGFSERVITVGYFSLINNNKVTLIQRERKVKWVPLKEALNLEMAFDHKEILNAAYAALQQKVKHEPIAFELLPDRFTLTNLQKVYELILDTEFDKRNFRKKVANMHYVIPLKEKQTGVRHKPGKYYLFSREVFDKTKKESFEFVV